MKSGHVTAGLVQCRLLLRHDQRRIALGRFFEFVLRIAGVGNRAVLDELRGLGGHAGGVDFRLVCLDVTFQRDILRWHRSRSCARGDKIRCCNSSGLRLNRLAGSGRVPLRIRVQVGVTRLDMAGVGLDRLIE